MDENEVEVYAVADRRHFFVVFSSGVRETEGVSFLAPQLADGCLF